MQRFLQLDPSWLRSGQTTSLFASVIEKDDVKDDRGGILGNYDCLDPTIQGRGRGRVRVVRGRGRGRGWAWAGMVGWSSCR